MNPDIVEWDTPFQKYSNTRWLVQGKVLHRILVNWQELLAYFKAMVSSASATVRYKVRTIIDMMSDRQNYLYFMFLTPIVREYERLNADFQRSNPDLLYLHNQMETQYKSMKERIEDAAGLKKGMQKPLAEVGFRVDFISKCQVSSASLTPSHIENVKEKCHKFLVTAVAETEKRLPPEGTNRGHLSKMSELYPKKLLNLENPVELQNIPYQQLIGSNGSEIESQLRKARHVNWLQELQLESLPADPVVCWGKIRCYTDATGSKPYFELVDYIVTRFAVPTANAFFERVFSLVSCVKDKYSNRMSTDMLDATLRVKSFLQATYIVFKI
jgi:hypothetical protein